MIKQIIPANPGTWAVFTDDGYPSEHEFRDPVIAWALVEDCGSEDIEPRCVAGVGHVYNPLKQKMFNRIEYNPTITINENT